MSQDFFRHRIEDSINVIELDLPSTLDAAEFDRLNESILTIFDGQTGGQWIIDLSAVDYVGSSVLGLIVNLRQRIKSGKGKLVLCGLSNHLTQIFRHSSLERLFVICRDREDAMSRLS